VLAVVAADADDLAGPRHRGEQLHAGERAAQSLPTGRRREGEGAGGGDQRRLAAREKGRHVGGHRLRRAVRLAGGGQRVGERRAKIDDLRVGPAPRPSGRRPARRGS
jgi:hypothetical protein